jgi:quercetin dioxygenase-like cupin family protein
MIVFPAAEFESLPGSEEKFTGLVWTSTLAPAQTDQGLSAYLVMFAPGARTRWHAHPGEQILHVLAGSGRLAVEGGQVRSINPGDSVSIAAGERHWHGAGPDGFMTHIAVTSGGGAHWMEPVSEEAYSGRPGG